MGLDEPVYRPFFSGTLVVLLRRGSVCDFAETVG